MNGNSRTPQRGPPGGRGAQAPCLTKGRVKATQAGTTQTKHNL